MKEDNYTSLEVSKKLVENGIVLETEFHWVYSKFREHGIWSIDLSNCHSYEPEPEYPAPSMSELWRELPERFKRHETEISQNNYLLQVWRHNGVTYCSYLDNDNDSLDTTPGSHNPADALA